MMKPLILCFWVAAALSCRGEGLVDRWDFEDNQAGKTLNAATGAYDAEICGCEVVKTAGGNVLKMGGKASFRSDNPQGKFTAFTVAFWIMPVEVRDNQTGVSALGGGPGLGTFHFVMGKDGHVFSGIYAFSRFTPDKLKPGTMKLGVWQFVAFTFDNTDARLYLDGAEIARMPMRMPDAWKGFSAEGSFLDDLRVYDEALSPEAVRQQWADGKWRTNLNVQGVVP